MDAQKKQIVLPGWVFDGLQLSATAFGGIGADNYRDMAGDPLCVYGMCGTGQMLADVEAEAALRQARINSGNDCFGWVGNDTAVRRINERKGATRGARVSFAEWCAELNVVADYMVRSPLTPQGTE